MVTQKIYINKFSIIAPGLVNEEKSLEVLQGKQLWQPEPLPNFVSNLLPANERRRTTPIIKIALEAAQSLLKEDDQLAQMATVFASSDGDLGIDDKICQALLETEKMISPTQFHNSVHNAPAGYWAIAAGMNSASVSLSAGNGTFAAGLIDSVTQILSEKKSILFIAYDVIAPEPLNSVRYFEHSLAIGLRLGINKEPGSVGTISLSMNVCDNEVSSCLNQSLESLRKGNPIGTAIPLLEVLATNAKSSVVIPYLMGKALRVEVN